MAYVIFSDQSRVWRFVHDHTGVPASHTMRTLGLERDGELLAGVVYDNWNRVNVWMHVAILPGTFLTPRFVRAAFEYPFLDMGCRRASGWVEESNAAARRLDEHLGFEVETRLRGAASDGGDVLIYAMWRDRCRWLRGRVADPSMAPSATEPVEA